MIWKLYLLDIMNAFEGILIAVICISIIAFIISSFNYFEGVGNKEFKFINKRIIKPSLIISIIVALLLIFIPSSNILYINLEIKEHIETLEQKLDSVDNNKKKVLLQKELEKIKTIDNLIKKEYEID